MIFERPYWRGLTWGRGLLVRRAAMVGRAQVPTEDIHTTRQARRQEDAAVRVGWDAGRNKQRRQKGREEKTKSPNHNTRGRAAGIVNKAVALVRKKTRRGSKAKGAREQRLSFSGGSGLRAGLVGIAEQVQGTRQVRPTDCVREQPWSVVDGHHDRMANSRPAKPGPKVLAADLPWP